MVTTSERTLQETTNNFAGLAQLEERFTCNEDVRGSIPLTGTKHCSYSSVIEYVLCTDETTV